MAHVSAVNIRQVALQAGVSVGTVSRVLNGHANVNRTQAERVQAVAAELGYRPSQVARQLVGRRSGVSLRTGNLGVLLAEASSAWRDHPIMAAYTQGVERACRQRGFHPLIEFCDDPDAIPTCVREGKVDGVLIKATNRLPGFLSQLPEELPKVGLSMYEAGVGFPQVMPDDRGAALAVVDHLWARGHRRIGFVCDQPRHRMFIARYQGYEERLRFRDRFDPGLVWMQAGRADGSVPEYDFPDMDAALASLWGRPEGERPTAVVAANDWMAAGFCRSAARRGLVVGRDVAVVGFDNTVSVCCVLDPPLTSYQIPLARTAEAAALILLDRIERPREAPPATVHLVAGELVERGSVHTLPE